LAVDLRGDEFDAILEVPDGASAFGVDGAGEEYAFEGVEPGESPD